MSGNEQAGDRAANPDNFRQFARDFATTPSRDREYEANK
jgi:hypothetical protein